MKTLFILSFVGILILKSFGQSLDDLSTTVCFLEDRKPVTETLDGKNFEVWLKQANSTNYVPKFVTYKGTGFFVRGKKLGYLVTAKHLAQNLSLNSEIIIGTSNRNESIKISFGELRGNMPVPWVHHSEADISIMPFWLNPDYIARFLSRHLLDLDSLMPEMASPSRDLEVTTLGFPLGLGVDPDAFSPISKVSKVSSGLLRSESGVRYFMLQDPSIDGFSGSPVYIVPGLGFSGTGIGLRGPFKCVGLISATASDSSGGKMAIVIPISYALQLINTLESVITNSSVPAGGTNVSK